jgi:hypothetical protein
MKAKAFSDRVTCTSTILFEMFQLIELLLDLLEDVKTVFLVIKLVGIYLDQRVRSLAFHVFRLRMYNFLIPYVFEGVFLVVGPLGHLRPFIFLAFKVGHPHLLSYLVMSNNSLFSPFPFLGQFGLDVRVLIHLVQVLGHYSD